MKWCDDKNRTRTKVSDITNLWLQIEKRWILPSSNTIRDFLGKKFLAKDKADELTKLNAAIQGATADSKMSVSTANWDEKYSIVNYWTSRFQYKDEYGPLSWTLASSSADVINEGTGALVTNADATKKCKVRAFYHF